MINIKLLLKIVIALNAQYIKRIILKVKLIFNNI